MSAFHAAPVNLTCSADFQKHQAVFTGSVWLVPPDLPDESLAGDQLLGITLRVSGVIDEGNSSNLMRSMKFVSTGGCIISAGGSGNWHGDAVVLHPVTKSGKISIAKTEFLLKVIGYLCGYLLAGAAVGLFVGDYSLDSLCERRFEPLKFKFGEMTLRGPTGVKDCCDG